MACGWCQPDRSETGKHAGQALRGMTSMSVIDRAVQTIKANFGEGVLEVREFRGQTTVVLKDQALLEACTLLRDDPELDFDFLAALTAVDYWPNEPRFHVVYQLYSHKHAAFLGLRVPVDGEEPRTPSLEPVFVNANWHEREIFDLFGITFEGNTDLRRILMPMDWEGHPLRKDYPLGYEEVQFTFNFDEIDRRKPYAKE
jgi:NADH-quinone oxidoreductase subunit C